MKTKMQYSINEDWWLSDDPQVNLHLPYKIVGYIVDT